jgi:hypothetical protein
MKPWNIKFIPGDGNTLVYSINAKYKPNFGYTNHVQFINSCKAWPNNPHSFPLIPDSISLSTIFTDSKKKQPIVIEAESCHFIPFEALKIGDQYLGERNPVSRKATDAKFESGTFNLNIPILIIKVFAYKGHEDYEKQIISTLSNFGTVSSETHTVFDINALVNLVSKQHWPIIHIIGHVVDDAFTDGVDKINLSELKAFLPNNTISANLIFLSCCGKLNFYESDKENLFSPFFKQTQVNSVVGMSRTIFSTNNQGYLDEFYQSLLSGKTVSESVRLAIAKNRVLPLPKEEDPLPIVHFGHPNCRFAIPRKPNHLAYIIGSVGLLIFAIILLLILKPFSLKFQDLKVNDLILSGRIENLPLPQPSMRYVIVAAVSLENGEVDMPEQRYTEIDNGTFSYQIFESEEERSQAISCYLMIIDISPQDESFIKAATIGEFQSWVNANKTYGVKKKLEKPQ